MIQNNVKSLEQAHSLALETAWQRYAQLETNAAAASRKYLILRGSSITLSVVATVLAIAISQIDSGASSNGEVLRACLILVPIVSAVILVFANKLQQGQYWQVLSTGAEEIKKEIYLYRTLLQGQATRHQWLSQRVTAIQRQVIEIVGGNLELTPYTGNIPPDDSPEAKNGDSALNDLWADDYLHYRLEAQLKWHSQEFERLYATRISLQIGIFALAGLSAFVAGLADRIEIWRALTTSMGTALSLWQEVSRLDSAINNYNQLILELNLISDRWHSLTSEERTGEEFFKLVIATEKVLWSQHNQHITQMRQAVTDLHAKTSDLLTEVMRSPVPSTIYPVLSPEKQTAEEIILTEAEILPQKAAQLAKAEPKKNNKKGLPHAFVVMPFGRKKGREGNWIDFNSIYEQLIKPALEEAGFESFRADEEASSGDILSDMFQELLLADLVLADLSIDNANVFYELGIRHALRKRGVIHIQCGRDYLPYDIFNVRALPYQCDANGRPHPQHLEKDKQAIIKMARATWDSNKTRIHSPIFNFLTGLKEPDRKQLETHLAKGYWQEYEEWKERVEIAKRQKRSGDVLLLTEEVSNPLIKEEAIAQAGEALTDLRNHELALKVYCQGLTINAENSEFRCQEAFHLSQLKKFDEAIVNLERLLQDEPNNIEAICGLAYIYKEKWKNSWEEIVDEQERLKGAYESAQLLIKSIQTYLKAYRLQQNDSYAGLNAFMLSAVLEHLAQQVGTDNDPEEETLRQQLPTIQGAIQFCLDSATKDDSNNYWALVSLGDLAVCTAQDPKQVTRAYKKALALPEKSKSTLMSTLSQLKLLNLLSFRPEYVQAAIALLQAECTKIENQEESVDSGINHQPPQVLLFAGHMIDRPDRPQPRFPAAMESEAYQKIEEVFDELQVCDQCLAIAPGAACGGDILFIEACLRRNMKVEILLPFERAKFIQESVRFAGEDWVSRFYEIEQNSKVKIHFQLERLGNVPEGEDPYQRNNRWALYSTLMYGIERVRLVVLWDGKRGDGPGGTGDMVDQVCELGGRVEHINTTKFQYWEKSDANVRDSLDHNSVSTADNNSDKVHPSAEKVLS